MSIKVTFVRDESSIHGLQEHRVLMAELPRNDRRRKAVAQAPDRVGMSPVVERSLGQSQELRGPVVVRPDRIPAHVTEYERVGEIIPRVLGKYLPRPKLGSPDNAIPPVVLAATGTDGPRYQIHVTTPDTFNGLKLHTSSGHQSDRGPMGQLDGKDQSPGVIPFKPRHPCGVLSCHPNVPYGVVVKDFTLDQPSSERAECSAVAVLGGPGERQAGQEFGNALAREIGRPEVARDKSPDLQPVPLAAVPVAEQWQELGVVFRRYQQIVQPSGVVVVERLNERDLPREDFQREPFLGGLVNEPAHELLDEVGRVPVAGTAGKASVADAGEEDPARPGLVGHGGIVQSREAVRHTKQHTDLALVRGELYGKPRKSLCCNNARGGDRTPMTVRPRDFENRGSAPKLAATQGESCSSGQRNHAETRRAVIQPGIHGGAA